MKDVFLEVELVNENAKIPIRGTFESAGLDFFSPIDFTIPARKDIRVSLGLKLKFPKGYVLEMIEKSGVAYNKKVGLGAKVIDSDYRGEIYVMLHNFSDNVVSFKQGEKICQGVLYPCWVGIPKQVDNIDINTERGVGGFGSTGVF